MYYDTLVHLVIGVLVLFVSVFVLVPYLFLYWKGFRNRFFYSGVVNYPTPKDKHLREPEQFGLSNTTNHSIISNDGVVSLWVLRPTGDVDTQTVLFYCHGASSNRGKKHRVEFYQVYQQLGYTIIAFDYRGYGDSKGTRPNETSVISDCHAVMKWTIEQFPTHKIIVWGHSLGTGISTKFMSEVADNSCTYQISGLILESGFMSATEAAKHFPAAKYWNWFGITRGKIPRSLEGIFPSIDLLPRVNVPVQLIHGLDDFVIPYEHSVRLKHACILNGKHDVDLHGADSGQHKWIHRNETAIKVACSFIDNV